MGTMIESEIAKVQSELVIFRDEYLPVLLDRPLADSIPEVLWTPASDQLSAWQQAVTRLGDLLPLSINDSRTASVNAKDFKDFMFQEASPSYSISDHGIHWWIGLFSNAESAICYLPHAEWHDVIKDHDFLAALPGIRKWLMGLTVNDCSLYNALCLVLPIFTDVDPPFVKLALDLDTWRTLVKTNAALSGEQQREALNTIDHGYFRHVLNNALLHVLGSLANNHFMLIRDCLDHPCLFGRYTRLMPHYVFAVLFHKVSILGKLAADPTG
jgi:hypothetical protein